MKDDKDDKKRTLVNLEFSMLIEILSVPEDDSQADAIKRLLDDEIATGENRHSPNFSVVAIIT